MIAVELPMTRIDLSLPNKNFEQSSGVQPISLFPLRKTHDLPPQSSSKEGSGASMEKFGAHWYGITTHFITHFWTHPDVGFCKLGPPKTSSPLSWSVALGGFSANLGFDHFTSLPAAPSLVGPGCLSPAMRSPEIQRAKSRLLYERSPNEPENRPEMPEMELKSDCSDPEELRSHFSMIIPGFKMLQVMDR